MSLSHHPSIVKNGLIIYLDAANRKSYSGSGTNWIDLTAGKNNGTLTNSPTYSTSNNGYLIFNGSNQYIVKASVPSLAFGTGDYTVDGWINFQQIKDSSNLITPDSDLSVSQNVYWWFGYNASQLRFGQHFTSNGVYCSWSPSTSTWYHIAATRISGTTALYINGISQSVTNPTIFNGTSWSQRGYAIARINGTPTYTNGYIASVKVYNVGLTASQILQNYNATKGRFGY
jgi:hypothetical protein